MLKRSKVGAESPLYRGKKGEDGDGRERLSGLGLELDESKNVSERD